MMPHDNVGKLKVMQWFLCRYKPSNKRMLMLSNCLAVGGKSVLFADIALETVTLLSLVVQPTSQIGKTPAAEGLGKTFCQVCNMIPMLLN